MDGEVSPALLLGIGNPGSKYEQTRHNIGMEVLRACAWKWGIALDRSKFESRWGAGTHAGRRLYLIEPRTYVNLCGRALLGFVQFFKVATSGLLILTDDVALPLGRVRIRASGSSGGHNGLKSVEGVLGTRKYARLRIGVGEPRSGLIGHVLGKFRSEEQELVDKVVRLCVDAVDVWVQEGTLAAMNRFNGIHLADPARPDADDPEASGAKGKSDAEI